MPSLSSRAERPTSVQNEIAWRTSRECAARLANAARYVADAMRAFHTKIVLFVSAETRLPNKKGGRSRPVAFLGCQRTGLRRGGSLFGARLDRPGILSLGIHVAVDKLDHADRRAVAMAIASLEHAGIAA